MNKERIIRLLEEQLRFAREQSAQLLTQVQQLSAQNLMQSEQIATQSEQLGQMTLVIEELTQSVKSLEQGLTSKKTSLEKVLNSHRALGKLLGKKSEKIVPPPWGDEVGSEKAQKESPSAKERGNNHAKRKEHFDMEV